MSEGKLIICECSRSILVKEEFLDNEFICPQCGKVFHPRLIMEKGETTLKAPISSNRLFVNPWVRRLALIIPALLLVVLVLFLCRSFLKPITKPIAGVFGKKADCRQVRYGDLPDSLRQRIVSAMIIELAEDKDKTLIMAFQAWDQSEAIILPLESKFQKSFPKSKDHYFLYTGRGQAITNQSLKHNILKSHQEFCLLAYDNLPYPKKIARHQFNLDYLPKADSNPETIEESPSNQAKTYYLLTEKPGVGLLFTALQADYFDGFTDQNYWPLPGELDYCLVGSLLMDKNGALLGVVVKNEENGDKRIARRRYILECLSKLREPYDKYVSKFGNRPEKIAKSEGPEIQKPNTNDNQSKIKVDELICFGEGLLIVLKTSKKVIYFDPVKGETLKTFSLKQGELADVKVDLANQRIFLLQHNPNRLKIISGDDLSRETVCNFSSKILYCGPVSANSFVYTESKSESSYLAVLGKPPRKFLLHVESGANFLFDHLNQLLYVASFNLSGMYVYVYGLEKGFPILKKQGVFEQMMDTGEFDNNMRLSEDGKFLITHHLVWNTDNLTLPVYIGDIQQPLLSFVGNARFVVSRKNLIDLKDRKKNATSECFPKSAFGMGVIYSDDNEKVYAWNVATNKLDVYDISPKSSEEEN